VAIALAPQETMSDIFTIASDPQKVFLGLGAVLFPKPPEQAAQASAASIALRPQDDYAVCIVGGRHEHFPSNLKKLSGVELQEIAARTIADWPGRGAELIRAGDSAAFFMVEMYTSVPCELAPPDRVTLVGDAIHAMTPTLGRGANLAMRDGALLGRAMKEAAMGTQSVADALSAYEGPMLDYGFAVVREAAEIGRQRMNQNPLPTN
jgi:2-polyprenyl-6-methoxyphenol hydroxylase-like FAD-dependent oxidoreductase